MNNNKWKLFFVRVCFNHFSYDYISSINKNKYEKVNTNSVYVTLGKYSICFEYDDEDNIKFEILMKNGREHSVNFLPSIIGNIVYDKVRRVTYVPRGEDEDIEYYPNYILLSWSNKDINIKNIIYDIKKYYVVQKIRYNGKYTITKNYTFINGVFNKRKRITRNGRLESQGIYKPCKFNKVHINEILCYK